MYQTSRLNTAAVAAHPIKADFLEQREPLMRFGMVLTSPFMSTSLRLTLIGKSK
jgi:hypothetical protein